MPRPFFEDGPGDEAKTNPQSIVEVPVCLFSQINDYLCRAIVIILSKPRSVAMYVSVSIEGEWAGSVGRVRKQDVILSWSPGTYHSDGYSLPWSAPTKIGGYACVCMCILAW